MSKKRVCVWFLEPIGAFTNRILVEGLNDMTEDSLLYSVVCGDGERRSMLRCSWDFVSKAQKSRRTNTDLNFRVWNKVGNGPVRPWKFDGVRKKPKIKVPATWGNWEKHKTQ